MKRLYFLLTWLLLILRPAQAQTADPLRQAIDHIFAPLDKTQVPAPYLAEYGNRFTSLTPYNGALTDSSVTTLTAWRLLYASVLSGNVGRPSPLPPLPDLNAALAAQVVATPAAIPLVVQCLGYAALRPDALTAGLLTAQNGQLYDVPNRPAVPYMQRTLFAAAPATPVAPTGSVSFVFAPSLHVHPGGTGTGSVLALSLDFGDGRGYQAAAWNVPLSAQYCAPGSKRVKVRVTYGIDRVVSPAAATVRAAAQALQPAQQVTYESWFDLYVREASCAASRYDQSDVQQLVHTFAPLSGVHSGGKAYVRFGGNRAPGDQTIRRPLIVAEGYDGFSAAPAVYKDGNYGVQDFINDIRRAAFNGITFNDNLQDAPGSIAGYDIVFLDYNNGTDDIRRNAALFEETVRWVNSQKVGGTATGEQNVVLGVSMGGLVARYGLAEMVKNPQVPNNDPHTRLLITHDSPHRGANTPLGIQMLTRQAAGTLAGQSIRFYNNVVTNPVLPSFFSALALFPELQQADDLLDAPATQQLLLVRALRSGSGPYAGFGASYNSFVDADYRNMITPAAGQSFPYRFIATSLGSQCGTELFGPHTELIRVERSGYLGVIGLTTGYRTEIIVNALPSGGQVERISSLRVWNETHILGISTGRVYLTDHVYHSPSSNPIAWDGLPGGTQPVRGNIDLPQGSSYFDRLELVFMWGNSSNTYLADEFCFVPRASALDVQTFDTNSLRGIYANGVTNGSATSAEKVIAQAAFFRNGTRFNQAHPFFPGRQAQWIFNEMQQPITGGTNAAGCTTECSPNLPLVITGPRSVCGAATYSVPAIQGATYNWTATPASAFSPSTGTGSTFATTASGTSSGQVSVAVAGPCPGNNFTDALPVAVCQPLSVAITSLVYTTYCTSSRGNANYAQWTAQATGATEPYTYAWYIDATRTGNNYQYQGSGATFGTCMNAYSSLVLVRVVVTSGSQQANADYYGSPQRQALFPNPADDHADVVNEATTTSFIQGSASRTGATSSLMQVTVYNGRGTVVFSGSATSEPALRLDTHDWPAGLYQVIVRYGSTRTQRQLSVQH